MKQLGRDFFLKDSLWVARNLLGKKVIFNINGQKSEAIINETEAYFGEDPASHGYIGKTKRNEAMFCQGGIAYVYFIYGMYFCLNFVTEAEGVPAAILIRGIELLEPDLIKLDGPGKLCRHLKITKEHDKIDLCNGEIIKIYDIGLKPKIKATPRIGISKNTDKLWRFVII